MITFFVILVLLVSLFIIEILKIIVSVVKECFFGLLFFILAFLKP